MCGGGAHLGLFREEMDGFGPSFNNNNINKRFYL